MNNVLPSGYVGGEAVKVYLLRHAAVPADTGTTSVVVGRSAQTTAQLLYISRRLDRPHAPGRPSTRPPPGFAHDSHLRDRGPGGAFLDSKPRAFRLRFGCFSAFCA